LVSEAKLADVQEVAGAPDGDRGQSALTQLRAWLTQKALPPSTRLPPERELSELLGVTRGELRKALAILEEHGELWRHVGKGTFVGARPVAEISSVATIAAQTSPSEVMRARLAIEPELAREAALHATADDIAEMKLCVAAARGAETWRQYENWDNRLHRAVAVAAHNALLLAVFDTVNAVRRTVVWGRLRDEAPHPPADHHSFAEHAAIVEAIEERDLAAAESRMRTHLETVQTMLLKRAPHAQHELRPHHV
jgi:GntR family transcriptional regulator, transcriptional repressor for pyruvate dehydrogenase complex